MRPDDLYLSDIIDATDAIKRFLTGIRRPQFLQNELVQSAVLQKLIVIGEAASRLSPEIRTEYPNIEWAGIVAFRNIAVHAYFNVDWEIVWTTARKDVPPLRQQIVQILKSQKS